MNQDKISDKEVEVKVKYPEIRKVLQKLYCRAFNSGQNPSGEDGYDFSTAYEEIEKALTTQYNRLSNEHTGEIVRLEDKMKKDCLKYLEAQRKEIEEELAHKTRDGYCCACGYDISRFERKLEVQKQEFTKTLNSGRKMYLLGKKEARKEIVDKLVKIETERWKDAEHCTCLAYAIVEVFGEKYEKILKKIHKPKNE